MSSVLSASMKRLCVERTEFVLKNDIFRFFGRPLVKRFALCYRTVVLSVCPVCLSVTLVYCGQTAGWIKMPLGREVGLGPGDIVLDENQAPPRKKCSSPPLFGPCLLRSNGRPSQLLLSTCYAVVSCAIIACNFAAVLAGVAKIIA